MKKVGKTRSIESRLRGYICDLETEIKELKSEGGDTSIHDGILHNLNSIFEEHENDLWPKVGDIYMYSSCDSEKYCQIYAITSLDKAGNGRIYAEELYNSDFNSGKIDDFHPESSIFTNSLRITKRKALQIISNKHHAALLFTPEYINKCRDKVNSLSVK